jgi:hypothetical protein
VRVFRLRNLISQLKEELSQMENTKNQKSLEEAKKHKAEGNTYFSDQNWTKAIQSYHLVFSH